MEYKGYSAQFSFDDKLGLFQGKVFNINDLVTFQGKSIETLRFAFHDAVNEYLVWCKKFGNTPEKPYSSSP
jgi:predicted HicB family RNase H-like nuclease